MNRFLERLNLIGVIALAILCAFQWRVNRDVNTELNRLQKARQEQSAKAAEQEKTIAGQGADLEMFRAQLASARTGEKELRTRLAEAERASRQSEAEAEQLKSSLTNWVAAATQRDKQLERAAADLKSLAEARDDAIDKYNELARKHNQLVQDFNRAATNAAKPGI